MTSAAREADPTVSVIMPTYNRAERLSQAVRTVLAQTFTDFELLVVNDGSADETRTTMATFTDPRVRVIDRPHEGVSAARNAGLAAARGEWIAFLDDDNEWLPTCLQRQIATAARVPNAAVVYCAGVDHDDDTGLFTEREPRPRNDAFDSLLLGWFPLMSTIMMRREVVAEIGGFRPELDAGEDVDFLLRAATTANFVANPEVLLVRHDHDGNRQWREPRRWLRNLEVLDRRWRAEIVFRRGRAVYVEWRRRLLGTMTVAVMFADADTEGRRAAARAVARLGRQLPWSARQLVRPVALLVLGARLYPVVRRIVRR